MKLINKTGSYFRELIAFEGAQSAGRFGFLYSVLLSNTVLWYVWLFVCVWTRTLVNIPEGVYIAYGTANGMAFAGKGIQSFAEKKEEKKEEKRRNLKKKNHRK